MPTTFKERIDANGGINCTDTSTFSGVVVRSMANIDAPFKLAAANQVHRHRAERAQAGTAITERVPIHTCRSSAGATINAFQVQVTQTVAAGAATVTVDLLKNGVSILTAVLTINSSTTLREVKAGVLTATTLAQNDVLEANIVATAGGGTLPVGLFAVAEVDEQP